MLQHQHHHIDVAVEGEVHILIVGDVREHDVAHVCIDTASATLSAVGLYVVGTAVVHVHLVFYQLVAPKDNAGLHLPHKKTIALFLQMARHIFLHGKVEGQALDSNRRKGDVFHITSLRGSDGIRCRWLPRFCRCFCKYIKYLCKFAIKTTLF